LRSGKVVSIQVRLGLDGLYQFSSSSVWSSWARLGQVGSGWNRFNLGWVWLYQVRLGQALLSWVRLGQFK
jgi:hypothetical protein